MSYQGYGCSIWITSEEAIKKLVPNAYEALEKALKADKITFDDIAYEMYLETWIADEHPEVWKAYNNLNDDYCQHTEVDGSHLSLSLGYIDNDADSDQYGAVWFVAGVEEMTPAGEKYAVDLEYLRWVEYG